MAGSAVDLGATAAPVRRSRAATAGAEATHLRRLQRARTARCAGRRCGPARCGPGPAARPERRPRRTSAGAGASSPGARVARYQTRPVAPAAAAKADEPVDLDLRSSRRSRSVAGPSSSSIPLERAAWSPSSGRRGPARTRARRRGADGAPAPPSRRRWSAAAAPRSPGRAGRPGRAARRRARARSGRGRGPSSRRGGRGSSRSRRPACAAAGRRRWRPRR